jgi:cellulose synthase/poly-beta-1,6-N-acetylglucosamine synthase-like glycosyltransferase
VVVCCAAEYCITEDYALSMELKAAGFKGAYLVSVVGFAWWVETVSDIEKHQCFWLEGSA